MTTDIFIRTYVKDLEWLKYCLKSISKFVKGHRKIIICIPEKEKKLLDCWGLTSEKVYGWKPRHENGYIDQQINKIFATMYSDADNILFVDSDVYFTRPTDISEFFKDGKPIILKTKYESVGPAICWKPVTERLIGQSLEYEYMRRLPLMYKNFTLTEVHSKYGKQIESLEEFSEFNLIGAYAELNHKDEYCFLDTEKEALPEPTVCQNWSWGGLTPEIKKAMEAALS